MKKITLYISTCAAGLLAFSLAAQIAHAETRIAGGSLGNSAVWSREGSPYVLENDLNIPSGVTLSVEPGTEITTDAAPDYAPSLSVRGALSLNGSVAGPVVVKGLYGLTLNGGGRATITHADIRTATGVGLFSSYAAISSSTISGGMQGVSAQWSGVSVADSSIAGNQYGIYVQIPRMSPAFIGDPQHVVVSHLVGSGGIGNALDEGRSSSTVAVSNTSFIGNTHAAIRNDTVDPVMAAGNWWGSADGPLATTTNTVMGPVTYAPWLDHDPLIAQPSACCSSILFLPGLEATRLYRDAPPMPGILGTSTNMLWEPNRNADVAKLYLDRNGSSSDPAIYSGGPIGHALGIVGVYSKFMRFLDGLASSGMIGEWKAFGYDWRKPIAEVVAGSENRGTTTESLIRTVSELAGRSKTGKVTLIAHSNGGLVAKYLVKALSDLGKSGLIDKVISVAVPYLGTPEAIAALLHGDDQALAHGLIASKATMRSLGINMASAYSLLPSAEYFAHIMSPTIAFASTTVAGVNPGAYPKTISSGAAQTAFIIDSSGVRQASASGETEIPIKGNSALMTAASLLHSLLDPYEWPVAIARYAVVGWNAVTTKGIAYSEKAKCARSPIYLSCENSPVHTASTTKMGDGTVVAPSAAFNAGAPISIDVRSESDQEDKGISHINILEASSTERAILSALKDPSTGGGSISPALVAELSAIPGVKVGEPDYSKEPTLLVLSTHSPVELHVYDSKGRHTGLIPLPEALNGPDSLYTGAYEENIPGSKFEDMNSDPDDPETQIYLPDDGAEKYSVVIQGIGVGEFTYDIERRQGEKTLESMEYAFMPVTPLTVATSTVLGHVSENVLAGPVLASTSAALLSIDVDGNGAPDIQASPSSVFDPIAYLESIKKSLLVIAPNLPRTKNIIARFDKLEDLIRKGKLKKVDKAMQNVTRKLKNRALKKLTDADRQQILDMFEVFLAQFES